MALLDCNSDFVDKTRKHFFLAVFVVVFSSLSSPWNIAFGSFVSP